MRQLEVVVIGGGLAGLASAVELVDGGAHVTLVESRPTLGGAVQTLPERDGDPSPPPDNGQHVALGACTAYVSFLERVGSAGQLARLQLALPVIDVDRKVSSIGPGPLGLLGYRHLSWRERIRVARVARRLGRLDPSEHDGVSFGELLLELGQRGAEVDRFWDVFIRPALNLASREASAELGIFTVKTALLAERSASDLLLPLAPLGEMHGDAAGRALRDAGATVLTQVRAQRVGEGGVELADRTTLAADAVVVATQAAECAELLGESGPVLEDSPIVSVHLWFDRPILQHSLAALLESPAHWVFDRGRLTGHEADRGQYLTVVSSGVPELMEVRGKDVVELISSELTDRLGSAELLWSRVSREPRATFAGRPGTAALRAGARTSLPGVFRAGAWTETGWPATMEGAVRSGWTAARLALERDGAAIPAKAAGA
jgi:squalene-associated FAD-dependent desaturase